VKNISQEDEVLRLHTHQSPTEAGEIICGASFGNRDSGSTKSCCFSPVCVGYQKRLSSIPEQRSLRQERDMLSLKFDGEVTSLG
jgi:hypothetical protein